MKAALIPINPGMSFNKTKTLRLPRLTYGHLPFWLAMTLLLAWDLNIHFRIFEILGSATLAGSDPPAHFTSGVLVSDYLRTGLWTNPMAFAESFYVRYPKVAIGHWPPVYYAVQALWYAIFPASVTSARLLSAAIALTVALVAGRRIGTRVGWLPAFGAALTFLALPIVQHSAFDVMSDLLTSLFVLLAILAFSDLMDSANRRGEGLLFLTWSILAILSKGTAIALAPFVILAPLLSGRSGCYRAVWYWGGGLVLALAASLFFLGMKLAHLGYPVDPVRLLSNFFRGHFGFSRLQAPILALSQLAPAWLLVLGLAGWLDAIWCRWKGADQSPGTTDALVAGALIVSQLVFFWILPLTNETRAYLPSLAPLLLLMARALRRLLVLVPERVSWLVPWALTLLVIFSTPPLMINRVDGYEAAARAVPYPKEGTLLLVASDPVGEGAIIVERLVNDAGRAGVVMRASALLAESNWMGTHSRPLIRNEAELTALLKSMPVNYVLLDESAPPAAERTLLNEAVKAHPESFQLLGRFPIADSWGLRKGDVTVYENLEARGRHADVVRVRLGLDRGGRVLEYHWR